MPYTLFADLVLALHFVVVVFNVGGLLAIHVGNGRSWQWVNTRVFRLSHLLAVAVVVSQSWLGQHCPLTRIESWLRAQAGDSPYTRSFVEHWLARLIYFDAPFEFFVLGYTAFGALVLHAWWRFPVRPAAPAAGEEKR